MTGPPPTAGSRQTIFHLQDYNLAVLHLVTLPNLILAVLPPSYLLEACSGAELDIDDETLDLFFARLDEFGVEIRFSAGSWDGLADELQRQAARWDLVLTAETIYQTQSVPSLLRVLRSASAAGYADLNDSSTQVIGAVELHPSETLTLIAAKVIYFGVGGDLHDFRKRTAVAGGQLSEVKAWSSGVGRQVLQLRWLPVVTGGGK